MTRRRTNTIVKCLGLAAGMAIALALLLGWRVPAATGTLGADVKLVATPPGELALEGSGPFLQGRALEPGGRAATGRLDLQNISPRTLAVQVRLRPSTRDLDRALRVELEDAGALAGGTLGALRRWSRRRMRIAPGERRRLDGRALMRKGAHNYEGRIVDATLEFRARHVGALR